MTTPLTPPPLCTCKAEHWQPHKPGCPRAVVTNHPVFHACTKCRRTTTETVGKLVEGKWLCSLCAAEIPAPLPAEPQVRITSVGTTVFELAEALRDFRDGGASPLDVVEKVEALINAKLRAMEKSR